MKITKCVYCNSQQFGNSCTLSPKKVHMHLENLNNCIYCGIDQIEGKCFLNPHHKHHISGSAFLEHCKNQSNSALILKYIFNRCEIINEFYISPLDRLYKRMAGIIASITEPLLEALSLQETPIYSKLTKEQLIKAVDFKFKYKKQIQEFVNLTKEANKLLPPEIVEECITDAILSNNEN